MYPVVSVSRPSLLSGQSNGRLNTSILLIVPGQAGGPTVRLVNPAGRAWKALTAAALAAGHTLKASGPNDSYRDYAEQERIFKQRYTTTYIANTEVRVWNGVKWYKRPGVASAAIPGTSNHGWGLAVDTGEERDGDSGTESMDAATLNWLVANEIKFGFSHEIQTEPWHIRYFSGDDIPPAVHAYEQGSPPAPAPTPAPPPDQEEDDMQRFFRIADGPAAGQIILLVDGHIVEVSGWDLNTWRAKLGEPMPLSQDGYIKMQKGLGLV